MLFNTGAALLDAIVLAVVAREPEGTYGYKITQEVRQVMAGDRIVGIHPVSRASAITEGRMSGSL